MESDDGLKNKEAGRYTVYLLPASAKDKVDITEVDNIITVEYL